MQPDPLQHVDPAAHDAVPRVASRPLRILIAEDNAVNQIILAEQLDQLGHSSLTVRDGRAALVAVEASTWDAMLLDCQMPGMDGFETVAAIRRKEAAGGSRIWVVAVTANALDANRETCLRAGMDDFLSKPIRLGALAQALARIPLPGGNGSPSGGPIDPARLDTLAQSKAVNGENLLSRMVDLFTESGRQLLDQMDQGLRQDDFPAAIRAAHKLAGGCGYFGAQELYRLCVEFENRGREADGAAARALAPLIRQEYARVEVALRRSHPTAPTSP